MGIVDEDIARVREAVNIADVIGQYTQLRRVGRRMQGLCPFHSERSPSFSVNAEEGLYYCFGCQKRGDVITFVREKEGLDFQAAVEHLAGKAGITLRYTTTGESEDRKRRAKLIEAVGKAVDFYHRRLLEGSDSAPARKYLRSRGLGGDEVRQYRIGWSPEGWDELARALRIDDNTWRDAGLGYLNKNGRQTDAFRGRVMFPIFDERGDPVGFGGRVLPGRDGAKYKNTSDDAVVYAKSRLLYGLNWAKEEVVRRNQVVICEGYTDVIGFAHAGIGCAVATCGTALTEDHVKLLKRFTNRLVLAFDADAAGQNAAARVYEWERSHEIEVAVADLPPGVDPADLARRDPAALAAAVEGAMPFLGFRVQRALAAGSVSTPEARARTAEAALAVVREHPSDLVRDQYLMAISDRCQIDADQLRSRMRGESRGVRAPVDRRRAAPQPADTAEDVALTVLVHRPEEIAGRLAAVLFVSPLRRAAFEALAATGDLHRAVEVSEPEVGTFLHRLAVEEPVDDADQVVADLTRYASNRARDRLRQVAMRARTPEEIREYAAVIEWLQYRLEELDSVDSRPDATEALLGWLTLHGEESGTDGG